MKTPKRVYKQDVCPECLSVVHWYSEEVDNGTGYETVDAYGECINPDCDFSVKGLRDHDGWEDHQQEARWKRKNREARLRRKIAYTDAQIMIAEEAITGLLSYVARLRSGGDGYPLGYAKGIEAVAGAAAGLFLKTLKRQKKGDAR